MSAVCLLYGAIMRGRPQWRFGRMQTHTPKSYSTGTPFSDATSRRGGPSLDGPPVGGRVGFRLRIYTWHGVALSCEGLERRESPFRKVHRPRHGPFTPAGLHTSDHGTHNLLFMSLLHTT